MTRKKEKGPSPLAPGTTHDRITITNIVTSDHAAVKGGKEQT